MEKTPEQITRRDLEDYIIFLRQKHAGEEYALKQELTRIRKYLEKKELKYLEQGQSKNLANLIEMPRDAKSKIREPYTKEEIGKFLSTIPTVFKDPFYLARAEAMFYVMFTIPIRRKEITMLEREGDGGLRERDQTLYIRRAKRGENWRYPLAPQVYHKIRAWLSIRDQNRPAKTRPTKWLFVDPEEQQIKRMRVSNDYRKVALAAGLNPGTHLGRHTVLSRLADEMGIKDNRPLKHAAGDKHSISVDAYLRTLNGEGDINQVYDIVEKKGGLIPK
jgi:site-specific recombinase XerD